MNSFQEKVAHLATPYGRTALLGMLRGIEREALRIDETGNLALDSHPEALGSALTHPRITTDYSESLLEFITPVHNNIEQLLTELTQTHAFSVQQLNGQRLWPVSMPCYIGDVAKIPIARYGRSHVGQMKTLYRKGLTHRYGAVMQIISGVHFNFSVSDTLWRTLYDLTDKQTHYADFISEKYFGLIRNYRRLMWVLPYLFGASPALCRSFLQDKPTDLPFQKTAQGTLYLPYATSLRMSDLGYTNQEQADLNISYNSLPEYLARVNEAIKIPSAKFAHIGMKVNSEHQQLNTNVLQIENELYAPIRAKRTTNSGEKPSHALARGGVEYIEVRALDVNPFSPIGIDASQVRLLDLFLLYCLMLDSPPIDATEDALINANLNAVVLEGRKPELTLSFAEGDVPLRTKLSAVFDELTPLAQLLDGAAVSSENHLPAHTALSTSEPHLSSQYQDALAHWRRAVDDPQLTLSGQVLQALLTSGKTHGQWVKDLAKQYHQEFMMTSLPHDIQAQYHEQAANSLAKQAELEAENQKSGLSFDDYLKQYFNDIE